MTVTAPPPAIPCSASKLLVETLTESIVSAGEIVHVVVRQPDVHVRGAVGAGRVVRVRLTVDVGGQRPRGRIRLRVAERHRRRSGHQVQERLVVAEAVERHRRDLGRLQLGAHVRLVGLQQLRLGGDRDGFVTVPTSSAMSTRENWPIVTGTFERTPSRNPCSETLTSYAPGRTLTRLYAPSAFVTVSRREVGFLVDDCDGCARNGRTLAVFDECR